jgi:hypothetical protein
MSKIEKPKILLKKDLEIEVCDENAHKIIFLMKKCVTIKINYF